MRRPSHLTTYPGKPGPKPPAPLPRAITRLTRSPVTRKGAAASRAIQLKGLSLASRARYARKTTTPPSATLVSPSPILYRPGYRPDLVREGEVLSRDGQHSLVSTCPRPNLTARDLQYYAVHKTRLKLIFSKAPNPRCRSLRGLSRVLQIAPNILSTYLSGRAMPSFGLGLMLARELGMEPYTFYAWLWERQQERAFWHPSYRPPRPHLRQHPRPSLVFLSPLHLGLSWRAKGPMMPLAPVDSSVPQPKPPRLFTPGALDWRTYDPKADPVYRRVMRKLQADGMPRSSGWRLASRGPAE